MLGKRKVNALVQIWDMIGDFDMSSLTKESAALKYQSEHYPTAWDGKVPREIRMLTVVRPDVPPTTPEERSVVAVACVRYPCTVNSNGAVTAITPYGDLGVKPGEFEITEWHE